MQICLDRQQMKLILKCMEEAPYKVVANEVEEFDKLYNSLKINLDM